MIKIEELTNQINPGELRLISQLSVNMNECLWTGKPYEEIWFACGGIFSIVHLVLIGFLSLSV